MVSLFERELALLVALQGESILEGEFLWIQLEDGRLKLV